MRPLLLPGGRARTMLRRIGRPLPSAVRERIGDLLARWDHRRAEHRMARSIETEEGDADIVHGVPVPPPLLRVQVTAGWAERSLWLNEGAKDATLIREMLKRNCSPIEEMGAILDFGCGCGRVARQWADLRGPEIHGTDVSRAAVRWCRRNLGFMRTVRCAAEPPLDYDDGAFDFVYSLSVFTHLSEQTGRRWLAELVRVLRPGGLLLFTVHGERSAGELDSAQLERFRSGELVLAERSSALAGTNAYASFHPPEYVRHEFLPSVDVELVEAVFEDPVGGGVTPMRMQDNYLVRKSERKPQ
jgi:SAM-dependent methyltransferase